MERCSATPAPSITGVRVQFQKCSRFEATSRLSPKGFVLFCFVFSDRARSIPIFLGVVIGPGIFRVIIDPVGRTEGAQLEKKTTEKTAAGPSDRWPPRGIAPQ